MRAHRIIEEAATEAVRRVRAGQVDCPPTRAIYEFEIEMRSPISDDARAWIAERFAEMRIVDDHTVAFAHEEMSVAYRMAAATQFIVTMPGQARHY